MHPEIVDKIVKTVLDKLCEFDQGELFHFIVSYERADEDRKIDIRKRISS